MGIWEGAGRDECGVEKEKEKEQEQECNQWSQIFPQGTKASRPAKASDLHVPAEGVRNIKSMWEKGNVFSSPSGTGTPNKVRAQFNLMIIKNDALDLVFCAPVSQPGCSS